jgi:hypothetical protein
MKKRKPESDDYKRIRRLYDAAGNRRELNRWITAALKEGKQNRGPKKINEGLPPHLLEWVCHHLERERGVKRTAAIKMLMQKLGVIGQSETAAIARIRRKVHGGNLFREKSRQILNRIRTTK